MDVNLTKIAAAGFDKIHVFPAWTSSIVARHMVSDEPRIHMAELALYPAEPWIHRLLGLFVSFPAAKLHPA